MKLPVFLLGLVATSALFAVDVAYSPPVGAITVTLTGASSGVPKISTFSVPMRLSLAASFVGKGRGTLTGVTSTTLTDTNAGWSAGALSQAATPYFIRIRSGAATGTWWQISSSTANTSTVVTVGANRGVTPVSAGITSGDSYEVVPADTLATLLGSLANTVGGTSASTADLVRVHDGVNWREYYYNTTAAQWREGGLSFNRNNTIIRPDAGVVYVRRSPGDIALRLIGSVSTATESMVVASSGVTVVGNVFPVARTLSSLGIEATSGFAVNSGDLSAADKVTVFDGINWRIFNYNASAGQWREGTFLFNRNTFAIPFGAPVIIQRNASATSSYTVSLTPPYTL